MRPPVDEQAKAVNRTVYIVEQDEDPTIILGIYGEAGHEGDYAQAVLTEAQTVTIIRALQNALGRIANRKSYRTEGEGEN